MVKRMVAIIAAALLIDAYQTSAAPPKPLAQARRRMVEEAVIKSGIKNKRVIHAMQEVLRHEFVAPEHRKLAYYDMAIPIGASQTISSPFIVAYMTESLDPQPTDKVLEIGTGSGYQAAVLGEIVQEVYTIEIVKELGERAAATLDRLGYENVHVKVGDGFKGWPEHAPFDKIIVTCSPEKVPQPLVDQLADGGLMVIPVGQRYQQTLYLFRKTGGKLAAQPLRPTLFVPMTGRAEAGREVQPDPEHPRILNGNFEAAPSEKGFVRSWYYQRQTTWVEDDNAPQGTHYVRFSNRSPGRAAHIFQGLAIDGRKITRLIFSAYVAAKRIKPGRNRGDVGVVGIIFYDEKRNEVGREDLGPFAGNQHWQKITRTIAVPVAAREAIVRVGMFGATGEFLVDDVQIEVAERN